MRRTALATVLSVTFSAWAIAQLLSPSARNWLAAREMRMYVGAAVVSNIATPNGT